MAIEVKGGEDVTRRDFRMLHDVLENGDAFMVGL